MLPLTRNALLGKSRRRPGYIGLAVFVVDQDVDQIRLALQERSGNWSASFGQTFRIQKVRRKTDLFQDRTFRQRPLMAQPYRFWRPRHLVTTISLITFLVENYVYTPPRRERGQRTIHALASESYLRVKIQLRVPSKVLLRASCCLPTTLSSTIQGTPASASSLPQIWSPVAVARLVHSRSALPLHVLAEADRSLPTYQYLLHGLELAHRR